MDLAKQLVERERSESLLRKAEQLFSKKSIKDDLKEALEDFPEEEGVFIPVNLPHRSFEKDPLKIKNFFEHNPLDQFGELTEREYTQRRKAIGYATGISPTSYKLRSLEELYMIGRLMRDKIKEMKEELVSDVGKEGSIEDISKRIEELERKVKAIDRIFQKREEYLKTFREKFLKREKEIMWIDERNKVIAEVFSSLGGKRIQLIENYDEIRNSLLKKVKNTPGFNDPSFSSLKEVIENTFCDIFLRNLEEKKNKDGEEKKKFAEFEKKFREKLKKFLEISEDVWEKYYLPLIQAMDYEIYKPSLVRRLKSDFLINLSDLWLFMEANRVETLSLDVKERLRKLLDRKTFLDYSLFGLTLEDLRKGRIGKEAKSELLALAKEEDYWGMKLRSLRHDDFYSAFKLWNLDLILEKLNQGKLPKGMFKNRKVLARVLGETEDSEVVDSLLEIFDDIYGKKYDKLLENKKVLSTAEYLNMLRELETIEFTKEILNESSGKFFLKDLKKVGFLNLGLRGLGIATNGQSYVFAQCLKTSTFPPDGGLNVRISARLRECFERYFSDIEKSKSFWEREFKRIGEISPVNVFRFPYVVLAQFLSTLRRLQGTYWRGRYEIFKNELLRNAEELVYSSSESIDKVLKEKTFHIIGVKADVLPTALVSLSPLLKKEALDEVRALRGLKERIEKLTGDSEKESIEDVADQIRRFFKGEEEKLNRALFLLETLVSMSVEDEEKEKILKESLLRMIDSKIEEISEREELDKVDFVVHSTQRDESFVLTLNKKRLAEIGEIELLNEIEKAEREGRLEDIKERVFHYFGLDVGYIQQMLDRGEIRNGMENRYVWSNIVSSRFHRIILDGQESPPEKRETSFDISV